MKGVRSIFRLPFSIHLRNTTLAESLAVLLLILTFIPSTVLAGAPMNATNSPTGVRAAQVPVVDLDPDEGNFFVLASDIPFQVSKVEPEASWFDVARIEGKETAHVVVPLSCDPQGLPTGIYMSAVRVDFTMSKGKESDHILIPVALRLGQGRTSVPVARPHAGSAVPDHLVRFQPGNTDVELRSILTPGGHYIFELIDLRKRSSTDQKEYRGHRADGGLASAPAPEIESTLGRTFDLVLPWMCLEYPCGRRTEDDIADVAANLDAVNHISYERYSMNWGAWGMHDVGDPGPWAAQEGLGAWPMVTGGYNPSSGSIDAMWSNRATIADNMIAEADARGYMGYCIDVEGHDTTGSMSETFIDLVDYLADAIHAEGNQLMVCHATWSTIAPIDALATTSVDYVATMDPYTSLWDIYIPADYAAIEPSRLIWGFTWDNVSEITQTEMWAWMDAAGYNAGVAGAAVWRTPLMPPHGGNDLDYYDGLREYYPIEEYTECFASVPDTRWEGRYFDNTGLTGDPLMIRDDGSGFLSLVWSHGSPGSPCGLGSNYFSAAWSRLAWFDAGDYRFTVTHDDGVNLYIDDTLVLNEWEWSLNGPATHTVDRSLSAGDHWIDVEYFDNSGHAMIDLSWKNTTPPANPWAYPVGDADSASGWWMSNGLGNSWYSEAGQRWYRGHLGEDWFKSGVSSLGEPVYAAAAGTVITVLNNCGNYVDVVIIEHEVDGELIYSFYGHIEANGYVEEGQWVALRQQIGVLGDPVTFEPHLHFEIKNHEALVNPPFSSCSNVPAGIYISAGYSGISNDYGGGEYYDPSDGIPGNRYYHPTLFIENHQDGGTGPSADCSHFAGDVNYPDGTPVSPGQVIYKSWRFSNCGTTTWSNAGGYEAVRMSGSFGPQSFDIPSVGPGQTGNLAAAITVPTTPGLHRATYILQGPYGTFGDPFWVEISVGTYGSDCSVFVADLSYPDGTEVSPGVTINKGWRLLNCGATTWSDVGGYEAVRVNGSFGPISFSVPTVGAGGTGDLYINMTTPTTPGTHRATYQLSGPGGTFGDPFWVEIVVISSASNCSSFVADLTYPDGTGVAPGETINKGWRLSNCGYTTWSPGGGYSTVKISGSYGPTSFSIPTVVPGSNGDLYASITVPTNVGTHRATYQLDGPNGTFGDPFWVEVTVASEQTDCSAFVADLSYPDGTEVSPGETISKGWRLSNCGNTTWSPGGGYSAVKISGSYGPSSFSIPTVAPGSNGDLYASITVPTSPGTHRATYQLSGAGGTFGDPFWVEIVVVGGPATIIVDDGDSGFDRYGPSEYWHREWIGYGGDMYWTYVNGNTTSNYVRWKPTLSGAGNYQVQVFIPYNHATSQSADYKIRANGSTYWATVNQNIYYDQWVTLGTYYFNSSNNGTEYVELSDATGEDPSTYRKIGFDAVKWAR